MALTAEEKKEKSRQAQRKYRLKNKEALKEYQKTYSEEYRKDGKHKETAKDILRTYTLKKLYNMTPEDYNRMFDAQEGRCKICGRHQTELKRKLCIDHNHTTGAVRGLLCDACNQGIGFLQDSSELLKIASDYLKNSQN